VVNKNILTAYHESARVVFAYLNGFACDEMELTGEGTLTNSRLNAGRQLTFVQAVLSGNPSSLSQNLSVEVEVAGKLLATYGAGTCAKIFLQNNLAIPDEFELDVSGQDLGMLEKIKGFLKKAEINDPDELLSKTFSAVFKKLKDPEIWKAIEQLASKILQQHNNKLTRFEIEDTLMVAGMLSRQANVQSGLSVGVHEDENAENPTPGTRAGEFDFGDLTPLDIMVRDFLKQLKGDWQEEEMSAAIKYLHGIYNKYGQSSQLKQ